MKLLSFGEIVWDIYPDKESLGGAPLNLAVHAAIQGMDTWLASAVGDDELGRRAISAARHFGVNVSSVTVLSGRETARCMVNCDENTKPTYLLPDETTFDTIALPKEPSTVDIVSFGTLALRSSHNRSVIKTILENVSHRCVFVDINLRAPFYSKNAILFCLENANILKMSEEEVSILSAQLGYIVTDAENVAKRLAKEHPNLELVLVTCGGVGAVCYEVKTERIYRCEATKTQVLSTVGAGDSFSASFLVCYFAEGSIMNALKHAADVSALVCANTEVFSEKIRAEINERIV